MTSNGFEGVLAKFENNIFTIKRFSRPLEKLERFASVIIENSLYESALNEGLSDSLIMDLVYIFGWDIDFIFDIRKGDTFKLIYETVYAEGEIAKNGDIVFIPDRETKRFHQWMENIQLKIVILKLLKFLRDVLTCLLYTSPSPRD